VDSSKTQLKRPKTWAGALEVREYLPSPHQRTAEPTLQSFADRASMIRIKPVGKIRTTNGRHGARRDRKTRHKNAIKVELHGEKRRVCRRGKGIINGER